MGSNWTKTSKNILSKILELPACSLCTTTPQCIHTYIEMLCIVAWHGFPDHRGRYITNYLDKTCHHYSCTWHMGPKHGVFGDYAWYVYMMGNGKLHFDRRDRLQSKLNTVQAIQHQTKLRPSLLKPTMKQQHHLVTRKQDYSPVCSSCNFFPL